MPRKIISLQTFASTCTIHCCPTFCKNLEPPPLVPFNYQEHQKNLTDRCQETNRSHANDSNGTRETSRQRRTAKNRSEKVFMDWWNWQSTRNHGFEQVSLIFLRGSCQFPHPCNSTMISSNQPILLWKRVRVSIMIAPGSDSKFPHVHCPVYFAYTRAPMAQPVAFLRHRDDSWPQGEGKRWRRWRMGTLLIMQGSSSSSKNVLMNGLCSKLCFYHDDDDDYYYYYCYYYCCYYHCPSIYKMIFGYN